MRNWLPQWHHLVHSSPRCRHASQGARPPQASCRWTDRPLSPSLFKCTTEVWDMVAHHNQGSWKRRSGSAQAWLSESPGPVSSVGRSVTLRVSQNLSSGPVSKVILFVGATGRMRQNKDDWMSIFLVTIDYLFQEFEDRWSVSRVWTWV